MTGRLQGLAAWISGGASGIGAATAELFAAEGARVAIVDVQHEAGLRLENAVRSSGGEALFLGCDVGDEDQVRSSLDAAAEHFGGLQIVVNGAGIVHVQRLHEYTAAEWDRLMAVNVRSIFFAVKHAIPHLRKSPRSYVVNIGSISSFVGQAATPAYTASKAAVLGLSRSIALDYAAEGVRCNCVCPGITDTPMLRHHLESTGDAAGALSSRLHRVPMGRALTAADIARAVLYFSCEDSAGVTGTSLVVDGGYLAAAEWDTPLVTLPDDLP
jgi:NAD(P)-dependent dehydrogenase (short-subunit alcohol dehydrogenase family)